MFENVWITGHKGYIGSRVKQICESEGYKQSFHYFDCPDLMDTWYPKWSYFASSNPRPDIIFHIGANADSSCMDLSVFEQNYDATKVITDYAAMFMAKMVFISTCQAEKALNLYSMSKRHAEHIVLSKIPEGDAAILRLFNVWGGSGSLSGKKNMVAQVEDGELPAIYEGVTRDFIHIEDVARTILRFLTHGGMWKEQAMSLKSNTYHVGTSMATPISALCEYYGLDVPLKPCPPNVPRTLVASPDRLVPGVIPEQMKQLPMYGG